MAAVLRGAVSLCLVSRFPSFVFWGPELIQITNDAFIPVLGAKHPAALGRPASEVWAETWDLVGPMLAGVVANRESAYFEDLPVVLERGGFAEDCYFTFCYSPIITETGEVDGVFATVTETTDEVVGRAADRDPGRAERAHPRRRVGGRGVRTGRAGVRPPSGRRAVRAALPAGARTAGSPFSRGHRREHSPRPRSARGRWRRPGRAGRGGLPRRSRAAVPGAGAADHGVGGRPAPGFLVIGLNPGRPLDDAYRTFANLLTGQVGAAVADASALDAARHRADRLAALDRAKTTFFANVSHELRTPLTLMLGPLEGLLANPATPEREQVEMVHRNALRLLRHVNTLLDFTSADHADRLGFEPVDLAAYTAELAALFRPALEHGGVTLVLDCRPLPQPVWVDRQAWDRIVLNLMSNAFKYTLGGRITLGVDVHDGRARLRVADTGVGISPEELPLIFDRFHRVEHTASRSVEGSGIGLSLVRDLLHRHDGTIEVTASPAGAARSPPYSLSARPRPRPPRGEPAPQDDEPKAAAYITEAFGWVDGADVPGETGEPVEVLVVDDNADMRAHLVRALSPHWRVRAVGDGQAALEAVLRQPPELVLTDVMMPRLDGFGLLKALRQNAGTSDIPVVMVSARAGTEAIIEGLDEGADDYLVKPFTTAELLARVRTQLTTTSPAPRRGDPHPAAGRHHPPAQHQPRTRRDRGHPRPPPHPRLRRGDQRLAARTDRRLLPPLPARRRGRAALPADDRLLLPLIYGGERIGAVELTGPTAAARTNLERPFLFQLVERAALALGNATRFQHEHDTALNLQTAMLTDLPDVPGLTMAALYQPAAAKDLVGGDWYDAFLLPAA